MQSRPYLNEIFPLWLSPALYAIGGLLVNFLAGALSAHINSELPDTYSHNLYLAVTLPLLTSYFWYCLRLMRHNADSIVMSNLLDRRALCEFRQFRIRSTRQLFRHWLFAAGFALAQSLLYGWREATVHSGLPLHSFLIIVMGFCFWLSFCLFGLRVSAVTNNLIHQFGQPSDLDDLSLKAFKRVLYLGMQNWTYAGIGLLLLPTFWLNQAVTVFDCMLIALFVAVLLRYLILPLCNMVATMREWPVGCGIQVDTETRIMRPCCENLSAQSGSAMVCVPLSYAKLTDWLLQDGQQRHNRFLGIAILGIWGLACWVR
ncbi:hypothetical protein DXV75_12040 [Alteromonas aestuariivivens]|uniref:Uncharacterized protein n=1 Tax=Alteromonas aestuariivivens TaxID=1938339 RepID=A0A3D8M5J2_9ALTE|nr:hypothetical protein [Alteromonas aestuariivivens]RDV24805.1 hypothetical protein DXV75_12040 [Alteromonas aestuariivivens]